MARERNEKLYRWRKARGMTQDQAADILGTTRGYYSTMESGGQEISKAVAALLDKVGFNETDPPNFNPSKFGIRKISETFGELAVVTPVGSTEPVELPLSFKRMGETYFVAKDEAMMPILQPGDVTTFKPVSRPVAKFTYLIKLDGDTYRVGNLQWKNSEWTVEFLNPKYEDIVVTPGQIEAILVNYYRENGRRVVSELNPDGLYLELHGT